MSDAPTCRACGTPMYVGLGTQPPVCDNRTCVRYAPSLSERKAGRTFPRPSAVEPEPLEDAPLIDWSDLGGFAPPFLAESVCRDMPEMRDVMKARALEVLREHLAPGVEVEIVDGEVRVTLPGNVRAFEARYTLLV